MSGSDNRFNLDLLIEECARDKVTGTSIAKQEATVLDANTVDAQQRIMNEGAVQLVVEADANILQNVNHSNNFSNNYIFF